MTDWTQKLVADYNVSEKKRAAEVQAAAEIRSAIEREFSEIDRALRSIPRLSLRLEGVGALRSLYAGQQQLGSLRVDAEAGAYVRVTLNVSKHEQLVLFDESTGDCITNDAKTNYGILAGFGDVLREAVRQRLTTYWLKRPAVPTVESESERPAAQTVDMLDTTTLVK